MTQVVCKREQLGHRSIHESLETQMENEAHAIADSGKTEDFREGIIAFSRHAPWYFKDAELAGCYACASSPRSQARKRLMMSSFEAWMALPMKTPWVGN
jgi:hypothetical protein